MPVVYYNNYLKVKSLKDCVRPLTDAHDEHLFIVTHQSYELWFTQILFELDDVIPRLSKKFDDNRPTIFVINHRLNRIVEIWKVLTQQFAILETMTPLDFLDFRVKLFPASGFQSVQFKEIEASLGLKSSTRYHPPQNGKPTKGREKLNLDYYKLSGIRKGGFTILDKKRIEKREKSATLLTAVKSWLGRMPFFKDQKFWDSYKLNEKKWIEYSKARKIRNQKIRHPFWKDYVRTYYNCLSLDDRLKGKDYELIEIITNGNESFSAEEIKATLFIMCYRVYPIFHLPFQVLTTITEIDEMLSDWRYRHLNVVMRMIGSRSGTKGEASGASYLKGIVEKNYIFKDLSSLVTYLIPKRELPELPQSLIERIGYAR